MRAVGNIVTGYCQVLSCLFALLNSSEETIKKKADWTILNITSANRIQIQICVH